MIDHFGLISRWYDRLIKFKVDPHLAEILELDPACLLLDAGGGTGRVSGPLKQITERILVSDISLGMLKQATLKDLKAICSDAIHLPLENGAIDRIIMMDALHHVASQQEVAIELGRVLARGGKLVIIEPNISLFAVKMIAWMEKILMMHSHFLSVDQIIALFQQDGLQSKYELRGHNIWVVIEKANQSN